MSFGLTNAPASFENLVNEIFADLLYIFVVVYLDDIMVFSSSEEEHVKYVASVLQRLRNNNLFAKASKCVIHDSSVKYLEYVVSSYGFKMDSSKVLFKDRVVIPSSHEIQLDILQKCHDSLLAGHPGQEKTLKLIKRVSYWAGMNKFIKDHLSSFQQCSRNKNIDHKKFGLLKPLSIPSGPWNSLSMDCNTHLLLLNNFYSILVAVDRFSKMAIFIPTYGSVTSLDLAHIFISHVFSKHGLPVSIVSDRGSLFVSSFLTNLCQQLKISRDLSSSFHPETDGPTERVNQILEQYLWMYFSYHQDDKHTWIPLAEFAYNNAEYSSTKKSPFFTIYGRNSSFDSIHISQDSPAGKLSTKLQSVQKVFKE
ncbi:hypothetical protein O181_059261 [Austropuccinia psidii MF-1]|uniref:Integrase catalytic domain-containing protein n=1 Tax=Austropuccinia psidii MF-1 TaxID=1389203 RepID=A0A9Q3EIM4_9BASI|nr:hypothetical protein [Austropuccinia psidii MF-1]